MQHVPRVADVGTRFAMAVGVCILQTELQRDSFGETLASDSVVLIIVVIDAPG
jgi:hypothetical protein